MRWATQALTVRKDRKEAKVIMDSRGHQVSGVVKARLAPEVNQVLEQKVTEVLLEIQGFLGLWDLPAWLDQKVNLELMAFLDHQVNQVFKVSVEKQELLELKATEGLLDFKDLKVNLVTKVSEVCKVNLVYQVCLGQLERKDPRDRWGCLAKMVQKAQEVTKGLLDPLDSGVLLGLLEMLDFKEHLGFKDHQEYQGIQDSQGPKVKWVKQEESLMQLAPPLWVSQDHLDLLVLPALLDLQDYQVPLVLLVCLASLVLKVTGDTRETREKQEYQ